MGLKLGLMHLFTIIFQFMQKISKGLVVILKSGVLFVVVFTNGDGV